MSVKVYNQTKIPTKQIIKSFIHMHFPVVISIIIILAIVASLLGSVSISSNEISLEPTTKNLVISTVSQPRSTVDVRGPYTVESALENEPHLLRLSNSALNTLNAQYGDYIYIGDSRYQLEQVVNNENDIIRIPESARTELNLKLDQVIRDSDLRSVFEKCYITHNIHKDEIANIEADGNETKLGVINKTTVNIFSQILTDSHPSKNLNVYVNDTKVAQSVGIIENGTYIIAINNETVKNLRLNDSSIGLVYNSTYQSTSVKVILEETGVNSTNLFVRDTSLNHFLNINF